MGMCVDACCISSCAMLQHGGCQNGFGRLEWVQKPSAEVGGGGGIGRKEREGKGGSIQKHMGGSGRNTWSGRAFLFLPCFFLPSSRGRKRSRNAMIPAVFGREGQTRKDKTTKPNDETKL